MIEPVARSMIFLIGFDVARDGVVDGRVHLRGDKAAPDQEIEFKLIGSQSILDFFGMVLKVGRTDRFVGILGAFFGRDTVWPAAGRYSFPYVFAM